MYRRNLLALTGWASAALMGATALWAMRRLGSEIRATNGAASDHLTSRIGGQPTGPDAKAWGEHLADEGAQLVEHGFEEQSTYLFAASGQLLEAADHARLP